MVTSGNLMPRRQNQEFSISCDFMMNKFTTELMFYLLLLSGNYDQCTIPNDMLLWIVLMEVKTDVFLN